MKTTETWLESDAALGPLCVFCDLDGTLVDYAEAPGEVTVSQELISLLNALSHSLQSAFAVISGRGLHDLGGLLQGFHGTLIGSHGGEIKTPGARSRLLRGASELPPDLLRLLRGLAASSGGLFIEEKRLSVALHFRGHQSARSGLEQTLDEVLRSFEGWEILPGRRVLEVRHRGVTKGAAVAELLRAPPFGSCVPVALGDDITDIDLFETVRGHGGIALAVGDQARSHADYALLSPLSARAWLQALLRSRTEDSMRSV